VHHRISGREKRTTVKLIISRYEHSLCSSLELPASRTLRVGELIEAGGERVRLTAIDTAAGRVSSAQAAEIKALWGVSESMPLRVKYSVHIAGRTVAGRIETTRTRVFRVGEKVVTPQHVFTITAIKTRGGVLRKGSAPAHQVVRLYGRL